MWQPGESGNPDGARKLRMWQAALERAILADDGKRIRAAVEKLLDLAALGEPWAIKELADRLDGKPKQQIEAVDDYGRPVAIAVIAYEPNRNPAQIQPQALPVASIEGTGQRH